MDPHNSWVYKRHKCHIKTDDDGDCIKAFHYVLPPGGEKELWADINPYDTSPETVNLWIDAGYPERQGCGPLHREDLEQMLEDLVLKEMFDESETTD